MLRATQANEERNALPASTPTVPRLAGLQCLSSSVVSVGGRAADGAELGLASPELLDFATGGHALVTMLVGGGATVGGRCWARCSYTWGQDAFGTTGYLELLTGIAVVVMISAFPQGAEPAGGRSGGADAARPKTSASATATCMRWTA